MTVSGEVREVSFVTYSGEKYYRQLRLLPRQQQ
jgi:hypothetical protein